MTSPRILGVLCLALVCSGCSLVALKKVIDSAQSDPEPPQREPRPVFNITYNCPATMPETVLKTIREYIIIDAQMEKHFETCDLEVDCFRP